MIYINQVYKKLLSRFSMGMGLVFEWKKSRAMDIVNLKLEHRRPYFVVDNYREEWNSSTD